MTSDPLAFWRRCLSLFSPHCPRLQSVWMTWVTPSSLGLKINQIIPVVSTISPLVQFDHMTTWLIVTNSHRLWCFYLDICSNRQRSASFWLEKQNSWRIHGDFLAICWPNVTVSCSLCRILTDKLWFWSFRMKKCQYMNMKYHLEVVSSVLNNLSIVMFVVTQNLWPQVAERSQNLRKPENWRR